MKCNTIQGGLVMLLGAKIFSLGKKKIKAQNKMML